MRVSTTPASMLVDLIEPNEEALLGEWIVEQERASTRRSSLITSQELERDSREFLRLLKETLRTTSADDLDAPGWGRIREHLAQLARTRVEAGFSPSETATFIFSLKQPLFRLLTDELNSDAAALSQAIWDATLLLDKLGLQT